MATASAQTEGITLTLKLSDEEAERLKAAMQNPIDQHEAAALRAVREAIWHALTEAGVSAI